MRAWIGFTLGLASLAGLVACGSSVSSTGAGGSGPGGSGGGGGATSSSSSSSTSSTSSSSSSSTSSSSSSSGSTVAVPECTDGSQCALVNDCCNCLGIPSSQTPPTCNMSECFAPACEALGQPNAAATCSAGQCVAGFNCDHAQVACNAPPPACPPGQTASVNGLCWGSCVPATECASVGACEQCGPGQACVKEVHKGGTTHHCVTKAAACGDVADCACMGAAVCVGSFNICSDDSMGVLSCGCPTC